MSRYTIGELAQKLGVSVKTLQNWDKTGKLVAQRSPTNRRFYTHDQYLNVSGQEKYVPTNDPVSVVRDKVVLITGGTGSLGHAITKRICDVAKKIIIFSRCELKQANMQNIFKDKSNVRYMIGDVRDLNRLTIALRGVDVCIHCASMKRIEACTYNPFEAINTIITGSMNVVKACIENKVNRVLLTSTDKGCMPATLYGGSKFVAEQLFVCGNNYAQKDTILSITRYGNVYSSNGSMRHIFKKQYEECGKIKITHKDMTRFIMTMDDAVDLNLYALSNSTYGGEIFIPKLKSFSIVDYAKLFFPDAEIEYIGMRGYEKIHEDLISDTEMSYVMDCGKYYKIIPALIRMDNVGWDKNCPPEKLINKKFKYNSNTVARLTKEEILEMERMHE